MRLGITALLVVLLGGLLAVAALERRRQLASADQPFVLTADSERCYRCHDQKTPGLTAAWRRGRHAAVGIGCQGCHRAAPADKGAQQHEGQWMVSVPTPARCGSCHPRELGEFRTSRHADAATCVANVAQRLPPESVALLDACRRCHGGTEAVEAAGRPAATTWPGGGMGRVHVDGSRGNCAACHTRHEFSVALARSPETCGKCHGGPDHPQLAIYQASRHGVRLAALRSEVQLAARPWIVGVQNRVAPTCATCHVSATGSRRLTHDPAARLGWQLREYQLVRAPEFAAARAAMSEVCRSCHSDRWFGAVLGRIGEAAAVHNRRAGQRVQGGGAAAPETAIERLVQEQRLTGDALAAAILEAAHAGRHDLHRTACAGPGAER
jgi:hypothetical protein